MIQLHSGDRPNCAVHFSAERFNVPQVQFLSMSAFADGKRTVPLHDRQQSAGALRLP